MAGTPGNRAAIHHAMTTAAVDTLGEFMADVAKRAGKSRRWQDGKSTKTHPDFRRRLTSQREVKRSGRRQKSALMNQLRYKAVEQKTLW